MKKAKKKRNSMAQGKAKIAMSLSPQPLMLTLKTNLFLHCFLFSRN
jgi:hypothetical protein